jgi:hypothetical protein
MAKKRTASKAAKAAGAGDITYVRPKAVRRPPRLAVPKPARRRLSVFPLSKVSVWPSLSSKKKRGTTLVLPFELNKPGRVLISLVARNGRVLAKLSVKGKRGVNRVGLPASFNRSLLKGRARLEVSIRDRSGPTDIGVVDIPGQTETGFGTCVQRRLWRFSSKIVGVAGFWAANDGWQHVIVATEDWKLTELYFNPNDPNAPGLCKGLLTQWWAPIVGVAGYYSDADHFQHVFFADNIGSVWEIRWDPSVPGYKLIFEWLAFQPSTARDLANNPVPGIAAIAAFVAPNTGWIAGWPNAPGIYRHFVLLSGYPRSTDKLFFLAPVTANQGARWVWFNGNDVINYDVPPPPGAFYSLSQNALTFVGLNFGPQPGSVFSQVIPLDRWNKNNGDVEIGKFRGHWPLLSVGDSGKIAAFSPDEIIVTGAKSPGDIFELHPDPQKTSTPCETRLDSRFYPGPNLDDPSVSWCKNKLAHFDDAIVALAGYFAPKTWQGPGASHAIVATDKGDVFDIAFMPEA